LAGKIVTSASRKYARKHHFKRNIISKNLQHPNIDKNMPRFIASYYILILCQETFNLKVKTYSIRPLWFTGVLLALQTAFFHKGAGREFFTPLEYQQ